MKYGKIEDGKLKRAPNPLWIGDKMISNPTDTILLENGYKPIEYTEQPSKDGYYYIPTYKESDDKITHIWEEHELVIEDQEDITI